MELVFIILINIFLLQAQVYRVLLIVSLLSLYSEGQCFILPIQSVITKERNTLDSAFRGLAEPMKMRTEKSKNVGFPLMRDHRQAYAGLILRG